MSNKVFISTIIASYNSEKTIKRCVDSLLCQGDNDVEIIVINDGSTDNTLKILSEYTDSRLVIKTIQNSGVSKARNTGIALAQGEYITFVDADDYVVDNYYQLIKQLIETNDADFYICCAYKHEENDEKYRSWDLSGKPGIYSDLEEIYNLVGIRYVFPVVWNKIFKTSIIKTNLILFDEGLIFGEDTLFNIEYSENVKSFCMSKLAIYHYMVNLNSATFKQKLKYIEDRDYVLNRMLEFCKPSKYYNNCESQLIKIFVEKFYIILMGLKANKKIKRESILQALSNSDFFKLVMKTNYNDKSKNLMKQAMQCYLDKQYFKMYILNLEIKYPNSKCFIILRKIYRKLIKPIFKKQ